ncbi:hypothetical protein DCAR_0309940 [Daucus carota subsp. sativus]|uniref:Coenzyme Q-binding protein COQ10 START domain-containing protein n=1 Tax=Daucus carota subsp. sativus TaxID=79200 RepID=A0A162AFB9_DAUCS|nr:PREDICTED: coenzyme Q-binding protein COQ10 homolog A, mitochondrial-like [Daucus carota subsp. sativus]XP_017242919.1 PREDICTED: coenzyme Q-binding protein COQ10 homolog A, mitochondrial-like [Daucus carota subsp. sativus]WOG90696.1 hypothetical protein DCAR_0309940 [Daucus carota subsp. sativus]
MRSFNPVSKALSRYLLRRIGGRELVNCGMNVGELGNYVRVRWLSNVGGIPAVSDSVCSEKKEVWFPTGGRGFVQRRGFLGCGDGDEGNVLAKVHEERRVMGYSPEQLFSVVSAVDFYSDFLPWCERSEIVRRFPDGSFDAELEIGFKFLVESYISHVEVKEPTYVKTTASESRLFHHLINMWEFSPGPVPGTCSMYFLVDFKFHSPFYRQMATMFFTEVATRLVGSFNDRCGLIYGPEVPVSKYSYQKQDA